MKKGSYNMLVNEIRENLFAMRDEKYRDFQAKLIPTIDAETVIGVRTPQLRTYAKALLKRDDIGYFLNDLPHRYYDENQLHAFIISEIKEFGRCIDEVSRFLPHVDNWATCDQLSPKVFSKYREKLLMHIKKWIESDETYTVRFGVGMLMQHFLAADFTPAYLQTVAEIRSEEYYVNMMIAWFFATALAKQYKETLLFIETQHLSSWTHNKAIQKATESRRITPEQKKYLSGLKV